MKYSPQLKVSDHVSSIHNCGRPVKPQVPIFSIVHVVLQQQTKNQHQQCAETDKR